MQVPIETLHLFPILDTKLITLLQSLSREEWSKPTRAKLWTVKDVVTHLLDGNLRTLSILRDNYKEYSSNPKPIDSYQDLVHYLNQLNAEWVKATKRLSPEVLIRLLETSGKEYHDFLKTLDPFREALFSVQWAGEDKSLNWFHIAREYTEKWHHQQQIREAVAKPGIMTRELYYPLINTFLCALPHTYRNTVAANNAIIKIIITGELGGKWFLKKTDQSWIFSKDQHDTVDAEVSMDPDVAWKLFTKGLSSQEAEKAVFLQGNRTLGLPVLSMVSVMA